MLVLSRHTSERILIGDSISIMVIEIRGDKVRLGIEAPKDTPVHREEVARAIHEANRLLAEQEAKDAKLSRVNEALRVQSKQHSVQRDSADVPPESPGES